MTTPILGAPELTAAQALPETTVNDMVRRVEQGAHTFSVLDKDLTAPPGGTPADGAAYIVGAAPTGGWTGKADHIAYYQAGWQFVEPSEGFLARVQDENLWYEFDGASWATFTPGGGYTDAQARAAVNIAPTTQSGTSYTAVLGDAGGYIQFTNGAAVAFTIPPNASVAFLTGTVITVEQNGAGVVTLTPGAGVTLNSRGALLATAGQYAVCQVKKVATDTWTVIGDVA